MASLLWRAAIRSAPVVRPAALSGVRTGASVASDFGAFRGVFGADRPLSLVFGTLLGLFGFTMYAVSWSTYIRTYTVHNVI